MWRLKAREDGDEDICMAVADLIFLASQIKKRGIVG
jgi:hypothetical protein